MAVVFASGERALMAFRLCCVLVLMNAVTVAATLDVDAGDVTSLGLVPEISFDNSQQSPTRTSSYRRLLSSCTGTDISISQGASGYTSNGIPEFTVNIVNLCYNSCAPWNIHLYCGSFSSAILVNPNYFKRLAVNDCLVNNGKGLAYGNTISFTYANSAKFPLSFRSMQWC